MATPGNLNVTVSDPISADIQAVCATAKSFFDFLCSPEGQLTVKQWREDGAAIKQGISQFGNWIEGLFK